MSNRSEHHLLWKSFTLSLLICFQLTWISGSAQSDDSEIVNKVTHQWKNRQKENVRAKWVVHAKHFVSKESYWVDENMAFPKRDTEFKQTYTLWLDLKNNLSRYEFQGMGANADVGRFIPANIIYLCDGKNSQKYRPLETNPDPRGQKERYVCELYEQYGDFFGPFFTDELHPVFATHGIVITAKTPMRVNSIATDNFDVFKSYQVIPETKPSNLIRLKSPDLFPERDGDVYSQLDVDPAKDGAIVKIAIISNGQKTYEQSVNFEERDGHWIPSSWSIVKRQKNKITESYQFEVMEYHPDPDLSKVQFHMEPPPGMFVYDPAAGGSYLKMKPGEKNIEGSKAVQMLKAGTLQLN